MNKNLLFLFLTFSASVFQTNAATILSSKSGDWNNIASWQGGAIPTADDIVIIAASNDITVSDTIGSYVAVCKSLTVNGSLTYNSNRIVVGSPDPFGNPSSGGNAPLVVNGTLTIAGGYLNSFYLNGYMTFNNGSVFNMTSGFMHVNGNTGSPLSSVAAGTPLIDFSNTTSFSANGGTLIVTNPHIDPLTTCIKGQKSFSDNASVSFGFHVAPITSNNYFIDGATSPSFQTIELNYVSNSVKLEMTDVDVKGAININKGTLYNPDFIKTIRIDKDINLGSGGKILGKIELNGTSQQNINPNFENGGFISDAVIDGDIIVNNTTRVKVKMNLEILGDLTLTNGKFDLGNKTLTLRRSPLFSSAASYIVTHDLLQTVGYLKIKNVTTNTMFPVGTEQSYAPVFLASLDGDYSVSAHPSIIATPSDLSKINLEWDITRLSGIHTAEIMVQWNKTDEAYNFTPNRNLCHLYHYNGGAWEKMSNFSGATSTTGTSFTKYAAEVSSFSTFSVFSSAIIPITLTTFKGKILNNEAHLQWETASEFNNAGFDIQKSLDGVHFSSIGFIKGQGNSSVSNSYSFIDNNFKELAYYRLNQTDFDEKSRFSPIVALQKNDKTAAFKAYPNPITEGSNLNIDFSEKTGNGAMIDVLDINGRVLFHKLKDNNLDTLQIPTSHWTNGIYFVRITNGAKTTVSKVIKN